MGELSSSNFGLVIAYLLPGFFVLVALERFSPLLQTWMGHGGAALPTASGFLYVTLASTAVGLLLHTVRWLVLDRIHHRTGVQKPEWDFGVLQKQLGAFELINESHYRYFQAYGNGLVAVIVVFAVKQWSDGPSVNWMDIGLLAIGTLLFVASRDALRKYYRRGEGMLNRVGRTASGEISD